ncbi:MAG: cysteine--tRNA ligase [SAR324 cluster bacterium]|nr:cysteine--tRNA ligase [SAR324 cluster bacterium]
MELTLFNTLSRKKEVFQPIKSGEAGIYTCGPTVYAHAHIGNLRSYVFPDVLKKTLRLLGYQVLHVINITDVGHLTSNADEGEDKLERAARQQARSAWDIAAEYTEHYLRDLRRLNIDVPPDLPRATGHIPEQIAMIEKLAAGGYTYDTEDGIYFDSARFPDYGRLARLKAEGLQEGSRVEMGGKRNKTDFALWKFSPADAQRQMEWESPWGKGFPGWHIECSAMSMKYLGERFDIHTGGTDHIPVHHTNEIAQSEAATGKPFVNYWLHGEYLIVGEDKDRDKRMGKSEGNLLRLQQLIDEGYEPLAFRYLALNAHYRNYLNFTDQALKAADAALMGLRRLIRGVGGEAAGAVQAPVETAEAPVETPKDGREAALLADLCDDLNTPRALATLWTALRDERLPAGKKLALAGFAEGLLSLNLFDFSRLEAQEAVPDAIREIAEQRWAARQAKDYAESDRLRNLLAKEGFSVQDGKEGYQLLKFS